MAKQGIENLFSDTHLDILKEIGSMGTAHAATALSKMINKKVTMPVPNVSWVEFKNVADFVGGPENVIVGLLVSLSGNIQGMMMHLLAVDDARTLAAAVLGQPNTKTGEDKYVFSEMERSAIEELANILVSSYLGSLAGLTNSHIKPSVPFMSVDMANSILSIPAIEYGKMADKILFIESQIAIEDISSTGCFILVPNLHSFYRILRSLGVE
ncbi:MAG: chemotaxis protein CheC [Defluviitaleaceae bacterium]|nr:chemotaxis protein CheC [Defluviitaleaceae bacterium]